MSPRRPYLLRAFYDWLLDNQLTPHLVVNAYYYGVQIPMEFVRDGQIILNIAPHAVGNLELSNNEVRFNARFGGVPQQVYVPMGAILAIYARENGAGTMFEPEPVYETEGQVEDLVESKPKVTIQLVEQDNSTKKSTDDDGNDTPPQPLRGRPTLKIVK